MKNIKQLIAIGVLSLSFISANLNASAVDLTPPAKPNPISGEITNDKIRQYNSEVKKYNEKVDEYNKKVDEIYNSELENVKQKNEEIEQHNQAEQTKVDEVAARNAAKQAEYDALYEQYQKDLAMEERIKAAGYESVEAYNALVVANNELANKSVEKNAVLEFNIDNSYIITTDETISGNSNEGSTEPVEEDDKEIIHVHIEHNFVDGTSYSTDFTINWTDTITFKPAAAVLEPTEPNSATFFAKIDDNHSMGYWYQTDGILYSNARISETSWNCGNVHTVSYREGKNHSSDNPDIDVIYNYSWQPLKIKKTYNVPKEPVLELEEYTPDFWEKLPNPKKKDYLKHLTYMDLIEEKPKNPDPEPEKQEPIVTYIQPAPQEIVKPSTTAVVIQPRMADTGDKVFYKREIVIIGCLAIIGLIIISDFIRKKKS